MGEWTRDAMENFTSKLEIILNHFGFKTNEVSINKTDRAHGFAAVNI